MPVPMRQSARMATYLMAQKLRRREQVPAAGRARAAVPVQPGLRGLRQDPAARRTLLRRRMPVEQAVGAIEECGAPMVSIAGGEPLIHPEIDEIVRQLIGAQASSSTCARTRC